MGMWVFGGSRMGMWFWGSRRRGRGDGGRDFVGRVHFVSKLRAAVAIPGTP
jgi:hypothetical protein